MTRIERECPEPACTLALAEGLGAVLREGDTVRLEGELGAGKTTFVRGIARAVGADPSLVSSPTFVIVHQYPRAAGAPLTHVDAYRLRSGADLEGAGWDRIVEGGVARSILAVEWPEHIESALPARESGAVVRIDHAPGGARTVRIDLPGAWSCRPGFAPLAERPPRRCPITGVWVGPAAPAYPFADERARLADLNRWFTGSYSTSRPAGEGDLGEPGAPLRSPP